MLFYFLPQGWIRFFLFLLFFPFYSTLYLFYCFHFNSVLLSRATYAKLLWITQPNRNDSKKTDVFHSSCDSFRWWWFCFNANERTLRGNSNFSFKLRFIITNFNSTASKSFPIQMLSRIIFKFRLNVGEYSIEIYV